MHFSFGDSIAGWVFQALDRVTGETGDVLWRQLSTVSDMPPAR